MSVSGNFRGSTSTDRSLTVSGTVLRSLRVEAHAFSVNPGRLRQLEGVLPIGDDRGRSPERTVLGYALCSES